MPVNNQDKKRALILIHGALMDNRIWLDRLHLFREADTIIMPDLAGHGSWQDSRSAAAISESDPALTTIYLANHIIEHSLDPIKGKIQGSRIDIVGHSLGGLVALQLQNQLHKRGATVGHILLGDSPIYPYGDTPSQQAAVEQLKETPLGRNLLANSFHYFNAEGLNSAPRKDYEEILGGAAQRTEITIATGLLGVHQRDDGAWDCGTFLSPSNRLRLKQITGSRLVLAEVKDAGHFVFHSEAGSELLQQWLENATTENHEHRH